MVVSSVVAMTGPSVLGVRPGGKKSNLTVPPYKVRTVNGVMVKLAASHLRLTVIAHLPQPTLHPGATTELVGHVNPVSQVRELASFATDSMSDSHAAPVTLA